MSGGASNPYIWPFPGSLDLHLDGAFRVYHASAGAIFAFVGTIMVFRGIVAILTGAGIGDFARLFKDIILYGILIAIIPDALKLLGQFAGDVARAIPCTPVSEHTDPINQAFQEKNFFDVLKTFTALDALFGIADIIPAAIWWVSALVSSLFTAVLVGITPVLLFSYLILQLGDTKTLGKAYLALYLWPILWNSLGYIGMHGYFFATGNLSAFVGLLLSVVLLILQLLSPILFSLLLRGSGVGGAVMKSAFMAGAVGLGVRKVGVPLVQESANLAQAGIKRMSKVLAGMGNTGGAFHFKSRGRAMGSMWNWSWNSAHQIGSHYRWNFNNPSQLNGAQQRPLLSAPGNWPLLPHHSTNPPMGDSPLRIAAWKPKSIQPLMGGAQVASREIRLNKNKGMWSL